MLPRAWGNRAGTRSRRCSTCWPETVEDIALIQRAVSTPIATGERLVSQYAEGLSAGASQVMPYVALVLILLLRPYGLFGQPRIERV